MPLPIRTTALSHLPLTSHHFTPRKKCSCSEPALSLCKRSPPIFGIWVNLSLGWFSPAPEQCKRAPGCRTAKMCVYVHLCGWGKKTPAINLRCWLTPGSWGCNPQGAEEAYFQVKAEAELRTLTEHGNQDTPDLEAEALFSQSQAPEGGTEEAKHSTGSPAPHAERAALGNKKYCFSK